MICINIYNNSIFVNNYIKINRQGNALVGTETNETGGLKRQLFSGVSGLSGGFDDSSGFTLWGSIASQACL